jgi:hypothetical protein
MPVEGYSGGGGGNEFNDEPFVKAGSSVVAVHIRSGSTVDSVQMSLRNSGGPYDLPKRGGNGGQPQTFRLQQGEFIKRIFGRCGSEVDHIHIVTNLGEIGDGGGDGGDKNYEYEAPAGSQIVGFFGRSDVRVDAIGVVYKPL